ncbi:MAG: GspH/FimT family pseudopilin [Desulfobacterales bacterium]|nr:GspH/FimT family pseudopilin [Desulfobacterales bacterium]
MYKNIKGFSTIEISIAIAIVLILVMLSAPNVVIWMDNENLNSTARGLKVNLEMAKARAIKENAFVITNLSASSYTIFVDNGSGGGFANDGVRSGQEEILANKSVLNNVTINLTAPNLTSIRFNGRGIPNVTGSIVLNNNMGKTKRININIIGRITIQ